MRVELGHSMKFLWSKFIKENQITLEKGPQAFKDLIHHVVEECVAKGYIK